MNIQDKEISKLEQAMMVLEHKDRWSCDDRDAFDTMKFKLTKLKTLRLLDKLENTL